MRTIDATLQAALDSGSFNAYIRARVRRTLGAIDQTFDVLKYKLTGLDLEIRVAGNVVISSQAAPTTIELIRGVTIEGVNYLLSTSKFISIKGDVQTSFDGISTGLLTDLHAQLINPIYISFLADGTYEDAISAFCTALGKTYTLKDPSNTLWANQFLPSGKNFTTNNAQSFLTLLRQKALIFACDNGAEDILFFCGHNLPGAEDYPIDPEDFYYQQTGFIPKRRFMARDENASIRFSGTAGDVIHNLGFIHSSDSLPTRYEQEQQIKPYPIAIQLYLQDGDYINFAQDQTHLFPAKITEIFDPKLNQIPWRTEIEQYDLFTNTEGGALPATIERSAPFTPLNTQNFDGNLDESVNNLQALAERVDELDLGGDVGGSIHAAAAAAIADADEIGFYQIVGAVLKKITWANVKATLKTYFDTLYAAIAHTHDASVITYTPADATDWNSSADPGDTDDALNQLADRTKTLEGGGSSSGRSQYGDGHDGAVTLDGANTFIWASLSGSTYTLTRDIYCTDLTVNNTIILITAGYRIFGTGTLTNNGTIHNDGGNAAANVAGTGGLGGFFKAGGDGGAGIASGGAAGAGTSPTVTAASLIGALGGRAGGVFLTGVTHPSANMGGDATFIAAADGGRRAAANIFAALQRFIGSTTAALFQFSPSGGGVGGGKSAVGTTCNSGGGGGGGGRMLIAFNTIINNSGKRISCNGGNGGAAAGTAANAGGGGGGGGGTIHLIYNTLTNAGTIQCVGGSGGASVGGGATPLRAVARLLVGTMALNAADTRANLTNNVGSKNSLYLCTVQVNSLNTPTLVEAFGLTFSLITSVDYNSIASPTKRLMLYSAYGTASMAEGSNDIHVVFSTAITGTVRLDEIENAPNTIVQSATNRVDSNTALTVTLPGAFGSTDAAAYGVFARTAGTAPVAGAGFVLVNNNAAVTTEISYNDTTVNMTHTTNAAIAGIAVEIAAIGAVEGGSTGHDGEVYQFQN